MINIRAHIWKLTTIIFMALSIFLYYQQIPHITKTNLDLLNPSVIDVHASDILKNTKAKVLVLWVLDVNLNTRTVLSMRDNEKSINELVGYSDQLFTGNATNNTLISQLFTGNLSCGLFNTNSKVGQYVAKAGAPSICRKGIVSKGVLIGYISLSYPTEPNTEDIQKINSYLNPIIQQIIVKK